MLAILVTIRIFKANLQRALYRLFRWSKVHRMITSLLLCVALLATALPLWLWLGAAPIEAAWADDNWAYRKAIPISAHASTESGVYLNFSDTKITTGSYTGDGTASKPISVGFQPTIVIIKGDISNAAVIATDVMGADKTKPIAGNVATGTNMVKSFDSNGFTVGSDITVNSSLTPYYYVAIRDTSGAFFKTFSYIGTGVADNKTPCGFNPGLVVVWSDGATATNWRSSHSGTDSNLFDGGTSNVRITGFVTNGFSVGTSSVVNTNGQLYYGFCAKSSVGFMSAKKYTGNGVDNTDITGMGFKPSFSVTKRLDLSTKAAFRFASNSGDSAPTVDQSNAADRIQSFIADGFQVGTDDCCNTNAIEYNSFSFRNAAGGAGIDTSDTSKFQADCGDIRFTDATGKSLPYYIVSGCGTPNTNIHVYLDSLPAGPQTIYMYYGNSSATNGFLSQDVSTEASNYTVGSIGAQEKAPAPVVYWKLDEGNGTTAADSGFSRNAVTLSGATWVEANQCVSGSCLYFDGSNDTGISSNNVDLSGTNVVTVSFWLKVPSAFPNESAAIELTDNFNNYTNGFLFDYRQASNGNTAICLKGEGYNCSEFAKQSYDDWHNYAFVLNKGNGGNSEVVPYVDGEPIANTITLNGDNTQNFANAKIYLMHRGAGGLYQRGFLDEVKIYPYARTANQIKADYASRGSPLGSTATLGKFNPVFMSNGLVGYWKMDEAAANSCSGGINDSCDISGNGLDGAWNGDVAVTNGKYGKGTVFDGTGDYVSVSNSSILKPVKTFTISTWFKSSLYGNSRILSNGDGTNGYELILNGANRLEFNVGVNGTEHDIMSDSTALADGTWHQVIGTYDGSTIKMYIDGVLQNDQEAIAGTVSYGSQSLTFGATSTPAFYFTGSLDETRVFNRALNSTEAAQLYAYAPGPAAYYSFEEANATTVTDRSGNGKTGTWNGSSSSRFQTGSIGTAAAFNGSDDYISATIGLDSAGDATLDQSSVSFWMYPKQDLRTTSQGILSTDNSDSCGDLRIETASDNHLSFSQRCYASPYVDITSDSFTNKWTHVAVTFDQGTLKVFINGVERTLLNGGSNNVNWVQLDLGRRNSSGSWQYFNGLLDEVRVYNYARSPKHVLSEVEAGVTSSGRTAPLGYWKLNEGRGTTANNAGVLGSSANGTLTNMSSPASSTSGWTTSGKYGNALLFDGTNDYVNVGNIAALNSQQFSVSTWFKTSNLVTGGYINNPIIAKYDNAGSQRSYIIGIDNTNSDIQFEVSPSGTSSNTTVLDTNYAVSLNTWYHLTAVFDGVKLYVYVNGKLAASQNATSSGGVFVGTAPVLIGARSGGGVVTNYFSGSIDEVRYYNAALSEREIRLDYNGRSSLSFGALGVDNNGNVSNSRNAVYCVPGDTTTSCAPAGEWRFEEKQGTTANDTSGNSANGTITSPTWDTGKVGSSLKFNGTDSSVSATIARSAGENMTISGWVNFDSLKNLNQTDSYNWLFGIRNVLNLVYRSGSGAANFLRCNGTVNGGATNGISFFFTPSPRLTGWHYLACSYDGAAAKMYVDGRVVDTFSLAGSGITTGTNILIGGSATDGYYFDHKIDEVRAYRYALSPAQVAWEYNRGKPVAYYKMDECQGGTAYDSSGNGLHMALNIGGGGTQSTAGTCQTSGTARFNGASGKYNASLNFDGTDDYAGCTDASCGGLQKLDFGVSTPVSWGAWIKTSISGSMVIAGKKATTANTAAGYQLQLSSGSAAVCRISDGTTQVSPTDTQALNDSQWHFVVCVSNGSTLSIYVDGIKKVASSISTVTGTLDSTSDFRVGTAGDGNTSFTGQIDEAQVFNYPLTDYQVRTLFNQNAAIRFGPSAGVP